MVIRSYQASDEANIQLTQICRSFVNDLSNEPWCQVAPGSNASGHYSDPEKGLLRILTGLFNYVVFDFLSEIWPQICDL